MVSKLMAVVAAAVVGGLVPAAAAAHRPAHPGAQRAPHHHRPAAGQPHIACTVLGCIQIPPECEPVAGRTPGGRPTGYDVIICPAGVWPLR